MITRTGVPEERRSQHRSVIRREDKRQPAMFGMVHLKNTAVFGACHVDPPWRGEDRGKCALWTCIENIFISHCIPPSQIHKPLIKTSFPALTARSLLVLSG